MAGPVIYFDNSATTPVDRRAVEAMLEYYDRSYGNPSSLHMYGDIASEAVDDSRRTISALIGAKSEEIIFTSGGSEANNLAIKGVAYASRRKGRHMIVSGIEHDCILETCVWLVSEGWDVTCLEVDEGGLVYPGDVEKAIRKDTVLVSVMHANNEIGTIEPVEEIGSICRKYGIPFHTDACQSFGKIPLDLKHVDLMTINAHKIFGPKGVGALFIREGTDIVPLTHGGGQERGMRAGTENVPGIVGFAKAAELCFGEMEAESERLLGLREKMIEGISKSLPEMYLNGDRKKRLPGNMNIGFHGREGDAIGLLMRLNRKGIAVSTGSACSAGKKSSHVLRAIGRDPLESLGAVRVTLGRFNTEEQVDYFLEVLPEALDGSKTRNCGGDFR